MAAILGPVASCVASCLEPVIEIGKNIVFLQFSYLCRFNSHIQSLRGEAEKLKKAREELQTQVVLAERKAEQILPNVQDWLIKANNEIQVNMSSIENEVPNVESGFLNIISRYSLSKEAKKTTDAMKALRDDNTFDIISLPAPPVATAVIPLGRTYKLESRKHIEQDIMEALRGNKDNIIGICGMGGVGKTTMAERIRNRVIEEHIFDEAVMATVGQELDKLKVLHEISDLLGLPEAKTLSSGAHQLHNRLKGKNKILIVVDDIWEAFQLENLGIPCQDNVERHHKVLLTSRDKGVLTDMGAEEPYEIKTLDEREARDLFIEKSEICLDDFNLLPIAEDIVKECSGLPLALTIVGSGLKDEKDRGVWEGVLQQLKNANPTDVPDVIERVYKPLKASYDLLHSSNAKSLFLLCSLFPEDSDISVRDLTLHCMGLRIFQGIENLKQARNTVLLAIKQLKRRFLLLDGSGEHHYVKHHHVRMHDVVRDVAKFIASEKGLVDVNLQSRPHHSYSECEWVSFFPQEGSQIPSTMRLNFPSLRILMMHCVSWRWLEIEDFSFLEGMKGLSVLSFKSISFKSIPQTMQLLKNLRALHLESCTLETVSIVGELSSLEILCCRGLHLDICELPVEIGKLKCLKLLEFSDCYNLPTIPPGVLSNLTELEELTMVNSFDGWELAEAKEKEGRNVNVSLHELQSLGNLTCLNIEIEDYTLAAEEIHFSPKIVKYDIILGTSKFESKFESSSNETAFDKKMHLNLPRGIPIGNWICTFATTTEELCLSGDGSNILDLLQAPEVKSLRLEKCSTVGSLAIAMDSLLRLEDLRIDSCSIMKQVFSNKGDGKKSHFTLPQLKTLELSYLESLITFYQEIGSIEFPKLTRIGIRNCPRITSLVSSIENNQNSATTHLFHSQQESNSFKNLERLCLEKLPALEHLWNNPNQIVSLSNLSSITVWKCDRLCSLAIAMDSLLQLQDLRIESCSMMEQVFSNKGDMKKSHITFPRLKRLELSNLESLTTFCQEIGSIEFPMLSIIDIRDCPRITSHVSSIDKNQNSESTHLFCSQQESNSFKNLERLYLEKLPALEHLWNNPNQIVSLSNLSSITVWKCDRLCSLAIAMDSLLQLEDLSIESCSMLEQVFSSKRDGKKSHITFPQLKRVNLSNLESLTTFCQEVGSIEFPMLTVIDICDCLRITSLVSSIENNQNSASTHLFCSQEASFGSFPAPESLSLSGLHNLEEIRDGPIPTGSNSFKNLKQLNLVNLPALEHLWNHNVPLSNLSSITVGKCDRLCSLAIAMDSLLQLQDLSIDSCSMMEQVFSSKRDGNKSRITFPQWKTLELSNLKSLTTFYQEIESIHQSSQQNEEKEKHGEITTHITFQQLEKLVLRNLENLTIFSKGVESIQFPALTDIEIDCPKLISLVSSSMGNHQNSPNNQDDDSINLFCKVTFGKLKYLTIRGYNSKIWCHQIPDSFFTGLERLEIVKCDSIRSLFSSAIARNLVNLTYLSIARCKEMVTVIEDDEETNRQTSGPLLLFPRLEDLRLYLSYKLGSFCEWRCDVELPELRRVDINWCHVMKVFTMGSLISTPNLIDIKIEKQNKGVGDLNELLKLHCYTEGGDTGRAEIVE